MKKLPLVCLIAAALSPVLASAHEAGDFIVRGGSITVRPNENSDKVLGSAAIGSLRVDNNTQLGFTLGYMVTDNFGVELLGATPFEHKVSLSGNAIGGDIGSIKHLPPSLMAQWYFGSKEDALRPYLGVGVNYTMFFSEKFNDNGKSAGLSNLSLKDSWGVAAQAGLDYNLDENWLLNASVWWMDIDTEAKFKVAGVEEKVDVRVDPVGFMFGVGYRF